MALNSNAPVGFLLIDKPAGPTSHDVVNRVRRVTGQRRVGHGGTLDPFASGLLIIGVGREATKRLSEVLQWDKEYVADIHLGATSDTDDVTGVISNFHPPAGGPIFKEIPISQIEKTLQKFVGEIAQVPPRYAAIKVRGKKLYDYARAGQAVERKPRHVMIHEIDMLDYTWPHLQIRVRCGSGTYIRALARDIGEALEVGGYLESLRRTRIGPFAVAEALPLGQLTGEIAASNLRPLTALDQY